MNGAILSLIFFSYVIVSILSLSIRSHLLIRITIPLLLRWANQNIFCTCVSKPLVASTKSKTTSLLSIDLTAFNTEKNSKSSFTFFLRLIPAVSIKLKLNPYLFTFESILSLVVPGTSLTMCLLFSIIELIKEDFPAFGLPTTANWGSSWFKSSELLDKFFARASMKSPDPRPLFAEIE